MFPKPVLPTWCLFVNQKRWLFLGAVATLHQAQVLVSRMQAGFQPHLPPHRGGPPANEQVAQPKAGARSASLALFQASTLEGWTNSHLQTSLYPDLIYTLFMDLGPHNLPYWLSTTTLQVWQLGSWMWSLVSSLAILTGSVPCNHQLPSS